MMRLNSKTEKRLFNWDEVKHLTKKEMFHLFIESGITGWSGVQQQKQFHAKERAICAKERTQADRYGWFGRPNICYECEAIFNTLKEEADDGL